MMTLIPLTRTTKMTQEQLDRFTEAVKIMFGKEETVKVQLPDSILISA